MSVMDDYDWWPSQEIGRLMRGEDALRLEKELRKLDIAIDAVWKNSDDRPPVELLNKRKEIVTAHREAIERHLNDFPEEAKQLHREVMEESDRGNEKFGRYLEILKQHLKEKGLLPRLKIDQDSIPEEAQEVQKEIDELIEQLDQKRKQYLEIIVRHQSEPGSVS